jgi:NAD(P)-dependent dehydrogenase (short-subunit alcohol dehydrogenase family)
MTRTAEKASEAVRPEAAPRLPALSDAGGGRPAARQALVILGNGMAGYKLCERLAAAGADVSHGRGNGLRQDRGLQLLAPFALAVNKQNAPKTDAEKAGLEAVAKTQEPYYSEEELGGKTYFTAVYPDIAVAEACISCHNEHADSPRSDFKMGETMGGVVVRIPLGD